MVLKVWQCTHPSFQHNWTDRPTERARVKNAMSRVRILTRIIKNAAELWHRTEHSIRKCIWLAKYALVFHLQHNPVAQLITSAQGWLSLQKIRRLSDYQNLFVCVSCLHTHSCDPFYRRTMFTLAVYFSVIAALVVFLPVELLTVLSLTWPATSQIPRSHSRSILASSQTWDAALAE